MQGPYCHQHSTVYPVQNLEYLLTYELVLNLISCWQLVGLGGLHRQADDLIGLLYLGQHYLGDGRQVFQAGVVKGVSRVAREGRSDLWRGNGQGITL